MDRKRIAALAGILAAVAASVVALMLHERPRPGSEGPAHAADRPAFAMPAPAEPAPGTAPNGAASPIRPSALVNRTGVAGRVVDEEGAPIAGATVAVADGPEVRADDAGRFEAAGLDGPTCDLAAEAPGFGRKALRGVRLEAGHAVEVTITLAARPEHLGRVIGPDEKPVAGAAVTVHFGRFDFVGPEASRQTSLTTDEHGWFWFSPEEGCGILGVSARKEGVGSGILEVYFDRTEILLVRLAVEPPPKAPLAQAGLRRRRFPDVSDSRPTGVVEGAVTDAAGHPVAGAIVRADHPSEGIEARADEDGRFRLLGVKAFALCRVGAARGRGPPTWTKHFDLAPGEIKTGVEIVLSAEPDLVVDAIGVDGRRAPGIVVTVEDEDSADPRKTRVTARTDASGRATVDSVPSTRVRVGVDPASLPPGVGVDSDENSLVWLDFRREAPVVIRLRPELVFRGQIVLEDGSPAGAGTITIRSPEAPRPAQPMKSEPLFNFQPSGGYRSVERYARAGPRGEFTFRARSLDAFEAGSLTRVVRRAGADPELQVFEPVARTRLTADRPNVVVVRKRGG